MSDHPTTRPGAESPGRTWSRAEFDVGGPVHALDFGGPETERPILLVHGLDGSAANFLDVGPGLATRHRTLAVDLPGFGRTPLAGRHPSIRVQADLVTGIGRRLQAGRVHLVGNSMGAVVALEAAARRPDLVASVTLLAPAVPRAGRGPVAWSFVPFLLPFQLGLGGREPRRRMAQDPGARVRELLALCYGPGSTTSAASMAEMVDVAANRDHDDAVAAWTGSAHDLFGRLARRRSFHQIADRVVAPVHLVEGGADPVIPASSIQDTLRRHPTWRHTVLAAGHAPMLEAPGDCVSAILGSLPPRPGVS